MLEIAKLTEGEKDSALAHVSEFGRFSKQMVDCRTDAVGVRVQRQADIAQKMAQESLRLIIKNLAQQHPRQQPHEPRLAALLAPFVHPPHRRRRRC